MDHKTSSFSKIIFILRNTTPALFFVGVVFLFSYEPVLAQVAENPLTVGVTITAFAPYPIIPPQVYPDSPPAQTPAPIINATDNVVFKGITYPNATIYLLSNGEVVGKSKADSLGNFDIRLRGVKQGTFSFGLKSEDGNGLSSKLLIFSVFISGGVATAIDNIYMPPTITSSKTEVRKGDTIIFSGYSVLDSEVRLSLGDAGNELIKKIQTTASGTWIYTFNSNELGFGSFEAKAKSVSRLNLSPYSDPLLFKIGLNNKTREKQSSLSGFRKKCDLNNDSKVNLLDFSIMAYWYKRLGFPEKVDLNTDSKINLTDLSILAYCWTG